jgi:tRNA nucleotidyltransferase (CCA-adding enzyme)
MEVDHSARQPLPQSAPVFVERMLEMAHEQACEESPVPDILMGRHLIEMGFVPGPQFGVILREAREAQLDGIFSTLEEAMEWVRARD